MAHLDTTTVRDLCALAIEAARRAGADYADIRLCHYRVQDIAAKDQRLIRLNDTESSGFGIRTLANGAWGFASSPVITPDEIQKTARVSVDLARAAAQVRHRKVTLVPVPPHVDRWVSPHEKNPMDVPLETKIALLLQINDRILKTKGIKTAISFLDFQVEHKYFMSTEGSFIEQEVVRSHPGYTATAVGEGGFESRSYQVPPLNIGYEHIQSCGLLENAERVASEAVEKLKAPKAPAGVRKDLVLLPSHLCLTIHESVAHPTELDRALGWEADYAGTTFCTTEHLGQLRYGSPKMNVFADRTLKHGRGTVGYDDDGVRTTRWDIVRDGTFVGYQTTRDTAGFIGEKESNGCSYADSWSSLPFLRIPNVSLAAGPKGSPTAEELIADTADGILIEGRGSYSIDQQRMNFQFGGDAFWEIKNGRKGRMLKDVIYQSNTLEFWNSLDEVCGESEWQANGVTNDGKGQPGQRAQQTHGCPPARFKNIRLQ